MGGSLQDMRFLLGQDSELKIVHGENARKSPNDPKLSDCGARRGSCEGGAKKAATDVRQRLARTRRLRTGIAATVTRGAVRCSAWLGVVVVRGRLPTTTGQNGESVLRMKEVKTKTVGLSRPVKRRTAKSAGTRKR